MWIGWSPPNEGCVKLSADGAMKGTMNRASAGGLFCGFKRSWIVGFVVNIVSTDSFLVELWGLRDVYDLIRRGVSEIDCGTGLGSGG